MGNVLSLAAFRDGYANVLSKLGLAGDRSTAGGYYVPPLSQQQIEAAYRSSWLTRKVHDLPPFEMTRAGRLWQAKPDQIEKLEAAETAIGLWPKLWQALTTARLHGGAALVLGVRQGMPNLPLNVEALGLNSLRYAVVVSRHQLSAPFGRDNDPESDFFGQPVMWEMQGAKGNSVQLHPSRVIPFHGAPLPPGGVTMSWLDQFWGDPLLISIKSVIDNAETSQAAIATLLHEMKQDVISIPGLTELIATTGSDELISKRIGAISQFKSMFNALLLDRGDGVNEASGEKWETRQLSFAQHPELLRAFVGLVAGAADIPVTRLMGESPGGLQSTGKGEQDDFNRMIDAKRSAELAPPLARIDEVLLRSTLGARPAEIYYEFGPLSDPDATQDSENEKRDAETVQIYANTNLIPVDALAKATATRLMESGRWPGLDKAIEESAQELGEAKQAAQEAALTPPEPANENNVRELERRGTVTRDQALTLLADAAPRSLYVRRDLVNGAEFARHFRQQGFTDVRDDLHVTIVYSRAAVDWMKAGGDMWGEQDGKLTVAAGGPRLVERLGDEGAVVLLFGSSTLSYRHEDLKRAGAEHGYDEYQPHVTITYAAPEGLDLREVEPYRGKLVFGPEIFEEIDGGWTP